MHIRQALGMKASMAGETYDGSNVLMYIPRGNAQKNWPWAYKNSMAVETSDG